MQKYGFTFKTVTIDEKKIVISVFLILIILF